MENLESWYSCSLNIPPIHWNSSRVYDTNWQTGEEFRLSRLFQISVLLGNFRTLYGKFRKCATREICVKSDFTICWASILRLAQFFKSKAKKKKKNQIKFFCVWEGERWSILVCKMLYNGRHVLVAPLSLTVVHWIAGSAPPPPFKKMKN